MNKPTQVRALFILLIALSLLAMLPVLLNPHWGMFSDNGQIVSFCKNLMGTSFSNWLRSGWWDLRPGAHYPDFITWLVWPNDPLPYFIVRAVCFSLTVALTFYNCFILSRSISMSFLISLFWFISRPTFEVIYTLDKGEMFLALLFSIAIYLNFKVLLDSRAARSSRRFFYKAVLLNSFVMFYSMFTKPSGQLLLIYAFLSLVIPLFGKRRHRLNNTGEDINSSRLASRIQWQSLYLVSAILACLCFQVVYKLFARVQLRSYYETDYSSALFERLKDYALAMPEWSALFVFVCGLLAIVVISGASKKVPNGQLAQACCLALLGTVACAAIALCGWRTEILYLWFPLVAFMLPASAYLFAFLQRALKPAPYLLLGLVFSFSIPSRIVDAQSQLAMDITFNKLVERILQNAELHSNPETLLFPFDSKSSLEIASMVEEGVINLRQDRKAGGAAPKFANMIRYFAPKRCESNESNTLSFIPHPGLEACYFTPSSKWVVSPVKVGDLMLIPYGDLELSALNYRGLSIFTRPWRSSVSWISQLELEPQFAINQEILRIGRNPGNLGWIALRVTKSPPLSIDINSSGWVMNGCDLRSSNELIGHKLIIQTRKSHRLRALSVFCKDAEYLVPAKDIGVHSFFDIPIASSEESISSITAHEKSLFIIQKMSID